MKAMDEEGVTFTSRHYRRGRDDGMQAGMRPLLRQFERKLARSLTEAERAVLGRHLELQGPDHVGDVALDLDGPAHAAWLADPSA